MVTKPINNFNKWSVLIFIFIIALLLAHLEIIENGFQAPSNYLFPFSAFVINAFYVAIGLFIFHSFVGFLDEKIPWSKGVTTRIVCQIGISLTIYLLFQSFIVYLIEPILNQNESTPTRILFTFIIGAILVAFINLVYLVFYFKQKAQLANEAVNPSDFVQGMFKGKKLAIPKSSFLLFYIEEGIIYGIDDEQQKIILKESLADLEKIVDRQDFFRANRKELIAKKAIKNVAFGLGGLTQLTLNLQDKEVLISRRRTAAFRKWLNKG